MMSISLLQIQIFDCRKDRGVGSDACFAFVAFTLAGKTSLRGGYEEVLLFD